MQLAFDDRQFCLYQISTLRIVVVFAGASIAANTGEAGIA